MSTTRAPLLAWLIGASVVLKTIFVITDAASRTAPELSSAAVLGRASFFVAACALGPPGSLGCGTTHLVRPVGAGHTRIDASVGGPVVVLGGAPIPVPMGVISVAHGLRDDLDVHADAHLTAAAFGEAGLTLGSAYHFGDPSRHVFTVASDVTGFAGHGDWMGILDPWMAYAWRLSERWWLSPGLHAAFAASAARRHFVPEPFVQVAWAASRRTTLELEVRWAAPFDQANDLAPSWVTIGGQGALMVLAGVAWDAGGGR